MTSLSGRLMGLMAAGLLVAGAPQARQPAPMAIDISKLGPQVGERVPGFELPDQAGRIQTLESVMGPSGAMLVFYRSADW